jgi:hypothetical protein
VRIRLTQLPPEDLHQAVGEFNSRYGEMEKVLWCLSRHCRSALISGEHSPVVPALIWTIKSWWGVQGVRSETKDLMTQALTAFDWSDDLFAESDDVPVGAAATAVEMVASLVERTQALGVERREYSLASKVLHWLLPWRVPVYDSFVRESLGVPAAWDHPQAYQRIVRQVFEAAGAVCLQDPTWVGELEPRSPLRAFDKCLWWFGGGSVATAAQVLQPWKVVDQLGLTRS